jgi:aryl-alcohol dehydrogenase-like predicted oxidoreductase
LKELLLSPIGLGLAALGRPGYINLGHAEDVGEDHSVPAMEARAHRVLDRALKRGVRYFDTARSYGAAEAFLGSWLRSREIAPGQITVASKWGYTYTAGWQIEAETHESKSHTLVTLQQQWEETRSMLGAHLSVFQIHSATLESGVLDDEEVVAEMARLKSEGTAVGITLSGPAQKDALRRALEITYEGQLLIDTVQVTWNLLERSTTDVLFDAKKTGVCVIVKEALANGRLTERNTSQKFAVKRKLLAREAERLATTLDAVALAAVLHRTWVDVVLSGATTEEQLDSNLRALDVEWDNEAESNLKNLLESPGDYWRTRSDLPWN